MQRNIIYVILILVSKLAFSQNDNLFEVENIMLEMDIRGNGFFQYKNFTEHFFEDERYIVESKCNGEFGGEIAFIDKRCKSINICEATCPLIINKIGNTYYLTTSLSHMDGACGFYEIDDPKELFAKTNDTIHYSRYNSTLGVKPLAKCWGQTILISFKYKLKIYHLVSDYDLKEIFIAERRNTELVKIQSLDDKLLYSYGREIKTTKDGHFLTLFQGSGRQGYIDIFENKIKIYTYK